MHLAETLTVEKLEGLSISISRSGFFEQEGRILLAISSLEKKETTTIREAARLYDVPRTTLQRRLNGSINRAEKKPMVLN